VQANIPENPWVAAQRFLDRNELPAGYAEQVVDFIQKNTGGVQLGTGGGSSDYVDPFTGGSRYTGGGVQPGGGSSSGGGSGGDPFTGGSRYTGGGAQPGQSFSGGGDPFTGELEHPYP
jgi:phospholipase A-2-activating protein